MTRPDPRKALIIMELETDEGYKQPKADPTDEKKQKKRLLQCHFDPVFPVFSWVGLGWVG